MASLFDTDGNPSPDLLSAPKPIPGADTPKYNGPKQFGGTGQVEVPDTTQGMGAGELALAGMGGELNDLGQGLKEKAQLAFRPKGPEGDKMLADINTARSEREQINQQLYRNPSANVGRFAAQAIPAIAAPSRLGAQVALQAALDFAKPGGDNVTGFGSEAISSGINALRGGTSMYGVGKGMQVLGKLAGAATGSMTPAGEAALRTDEAARNLGLPPLSVGQLAPDSAFGKIDAALPGSGQRVIDQAAALDQATGKPLSLPEGDVWRKGAAYQDELKQAVQNRLDLGTQKYRDVDSYVAANGLQGIKPTYTANVLTSKNNKGYQSALDDLEYYGFDGARNVPGMNAAQIKSQPMTFEEYHNLRVATNKSLNTAQRAIDTSRRIGTSLDPELIQKRAYLSDLKTALDSDAERWASLNQGNGDALGLYKDATNYYRDVVAPTVLDNPIAGKLLSRRNGFKDGEEATRASLSNSGMPKVDLLQPTMTDRGADMTQVLRNLPDVRERLLFGKSPDQSSVGPVLRAALTAAGHPISAVEAISSHLPGIDRLMESGLMKRLFFAQNPLEGASPALQGGLSAVRSRFAPSQGLVPRAAYGAAQYPQDSVDDYLRGVSASPKH